MKMRLFYFLFVFLTLFSLNCCAKSPENIYTLLTELSENFGDEYGFSVLYSDSEQQGFTKCDMQTVGRLYKGKWEDPSCASKIKEFAIRLPLDDSGFEIHILRCVNISDIDEVKSLLQKRIDRLQNSEIKDYAPESYEKYYVGAEIYVKGDTVFLLATPDNRSIKKIINN